MFRLEVAVTRVINYTGTRVFPYNGFKAHVIKIPVYTCVFKNTRELELEYSYI